MANGKLQRVTKSEPCQICGKPDYCCTLEKYHWCMRIESSRPHNKGGWLHLRADIPPTPLAVTPRPMERVTDEQYHAKWQPVAARASREAWLRILGLAIELGVHRAALDRMGVGMAIIDGKEVWTFPERNGAGLVVGIATRLAVPVDGKQKRCAKGSRRGLTYASDWQKDEGAIWIVEGASDVAACLSLGLCAIGRPSNIGGVDMLSTILSQSLDRKIVVCGERDKKPALWVHQSNPLHSTKCKGCSLCWPGKYGMERVAKALANRLGVVIYQTMPPAGCKDFRDFLKSLKDSTEKEIAGAINVLRQGKFPTANWRVRKTHTPGAGADNSANGQGTPVPPRRL